MKKISAIITVIAFTALSTNLHAQSKYPFSIDKTGKGKQSIIFIPGFACSGKVWDSTKINYEKNFSCYTLTMAGFAGVPAQPGAGFISWENAVAAFIKDNKIDKPVIVGHSMGGAMAMALAADYPGLVSKIVAVDALPCLAALANPAFQSNPNNDCSAMVTQMKAMSDSQFYTMQQFTMPRLIADTTMMSAVINWSVQSDRTTFAFMYCDFSNTDLRAKIAAVKCPALIMLEPSFSNYKPAVDDEFKNMKTANIQYATKGLHFIMFDDKSWYDKQLNDFLKP